LEIIQDRRVFKRADQRYRGDGMKAEKHFLMEDIYDYLMENNAFIGTNIKDEFSDSWVDCERGIIYLHGSKTLPNFKLIIQQSEAK
jgi:hypothetical protein